MKLENAPKSVIDRSTWPAGEWDNEPDKMSWTDEETNLPCLIVRNHVGGLCGYVGVSPDHPLHGHDYDTVAAEVHGGLTYSNACQEGSLYGICHTPKPGQPEDVWWFGFDCVHLGDIAPGMLLYRLPTLGNESYKDVAYVSGEVWRLAKQLRDLGEAKELESGQQTSESGSDGPS